MEREGEWLVPPAPQAAALAPGRLEPCAEEPQLEVVPASVNAGHQQILEPGVAGTGPEVPPLDRVVPRRAREPEALYALDARMACVVVALNRLPVVAPSAPVVDLESQAARVV
jgi:hypothetical protein